MLVFTEPELAGEVCLDDDDVKEGGPAFSNGFPGGLGSLGGVGGGLLLLLLLLL